VDERTGEELRSAATALLPDPRSEGFVIRDRGSSHWRKMTLDDQCAAVRDLELPSAVDPEVRHQFDLARNLLIYAWFVYRFHSVSQLQALRTLELALRRRLPDTARIQGIKVLLDMALESGYLLSEDFATQATPEPLGAALRDAQRQVAGQAPLDAHEHTIEFIRSFRNDLAHGEPWLHPNSRLVLALVAQLISGLYRQRVVHAPKKE
jgi:hypothetical protein